MMSFKKLKPTIILSKQSGVSLLEVSLSVGIIAVILVLATMLYTTTSTNQLINVLTTNMGALTDAELRYANNNQGNYSTIVNDLVNQGYLSPSIATCTGGGTGTTPYSNCNVPNPWGGIISITATTGTNANGVKLSGVANSVVTCNQISQQNKTDLTCNPTTLAITKIIGTGT